MVRDEFVVVFMEDGATVQKCKSFKYNLQGILDKYYKTPPS